MKHIYTPNESDKAQLKEVFEVIDSLPNAIKSGKIDDKTREIIESHFFYSMQDFFDEYSANEPNIENLANAKFITLFEASLLIGGCVDSENPEGLLTYSSAMFSDGFLRGEIDPRHPLTLAKYSAFQPAPRAGVVISVESETNVIPNKLGQIVINEIPDLNWKITPKEAAEFAILKGYPEKLFPDFLTEATYQPTETIKNESSIEITEKERVKLLSIIGLLAEALADTNPGDLRNKSGDIVLGNGEIGKEGKTNLLFEILKTVKVLELSKPYGLGKTTLETVIKESITQGIDALIERK